MGGQGWGGMDCGDTLIEYVVLMLFLLDQNPISWRLGLSLLYSLSAKLSGCHLLRVPKYWLRETHWSK